MMQEAIPNRRSPLRPLPAAALFSLALPLLGAAGCSDGPPRGSSDTLEAAVIADEAVGAWAPSDSVARILDIAVGADGTVWALNSTDPFLVEMSPEGDVLSYRGKRGNGKGEFRAPVRLLRSGKPDRVWAYDFRHSKLVLVDEPEGESSEILLDLSSDPPHRVARMEFDPLTDGTPIMEGTEEGILIAHAPTGWDDQWDPMAELWGFEIARLAADGSMSAVLRVSELVGDPSSRFGSRKAFFPFPYWTACSDGSMLLYDPLTNSVRRLASDGRETGSHSLPAERRTEVTLESLWTLISPQIMGVAGSPGFEDLPPDSAFLQDMMKENIADEGGLDEQTTQFFPEYRSLACEESSGSIWIQIFDTGSPGRSIGDGPEWLRVARDGAARKFRFPDDFFPMRFMKDRIWGVRRDDLDVESVAWVATPE